MHKSQLAGIIIDCETEDLDPAASFWSLALGLELVPPPDNEDPKYALLKTGPPGH